MTIPDLEVHEACTLCGGSGVEPFENLGRRDSPLYPGISPRLTTGGACPRCGGTGVEADAAAPEPSPHEVPRRRTGWLRSLLGRGGTSD